MIKSNKGIAMSKYVSLLLNECMETMNEEVVRPSYHYCLTKAAMKTIYRINLCESITMSDELFFEYCKLGISDHVRLEATKCLVRMFQTPSGISKRILSTLTDILIRDPSIMMKENIISALAKYPPIKLVVV